MNRPNAAALAVSGLAAGFSIGHFCPVLALRTSRDSHPLRNGALSRRTATADYQDPAGSILVTSSPGGSSSS